MQDPHISELRFVNITHRIRESDGEVSFYQDNYTCHESQVDALIKASVCLYHEGGNPYSGVRLDNLWTIHVSRFGLIPNSYWWTSPELRTDDPNAAQLYEKDYDGERRAWAHPDLIREERRLADSGQADSEQVDRS